jgi:hypothetical protein
MSQGRAPVDTAGHWPPRSISVDCLAFPARTSMGEIAAGFCQQQRGLQ